MYLYHKRKLLEADSKPRGDLFPCAMSLASEELNNE